LEEYSRAGFADHSPALPTLDLNARCHESCDSHAPILAVVACALHDARPACPDAVRDRKEPSMLETIAVILIVLWLLGMVSGYTIGAFIHLLLVIAIILFLVRLIGGRRVV
jgi:hypothetical protein